MTREKLGRKRTLQPLAVSDVDIPARVRASLTQHSKKVEGALTRQHRGETHNSQCSNLAPEDMKFSYKNPAQLSCLHLKLLCWRTGLELLPMQGNRGLISIGSIQKLWGEIYTCCNCRIWEQPANSLALFPAGGFACSLLKVSHLGKHTLSS